MSLLKREGAMIDVDSTRSGEPFRFSGDWRAAAVAALILAICAGALTFAGVSRTGFAQLYNLDDTYIHLTIARNLAFRGTWGINPGEFAGASSSPLWTLMLAGAMKIAGPRIWLPLLINAIEIPFVVLGLWLVLRRFLVRPRMLVAGIVAVGLIIPIPMLLMNGMEQMLQVALILGLLNVLLDIYLQRRDPVVAGGPKVELRPRDGQRDSWCNSRRPGGRSARFESLFLVFAACTILLLSGRGSWQSCWVRRRGFRSQSTRPTPFIRAERGCRIRF